MPFLGRWGALFLHVSIAIGPNAPPPHWSANYCIPGESGPTGWARSKTLLDTDWHRYVRGIQQGNCTYIAREVRGAINF